MFTYYVCEVYTVNVIYTHIYVYIKDKYVRFIYKTIIFIYNLNYLQV